VSYTAKVKNGCKNMMYSDDLSYFQVDVPKGFAHIYTCSTEGLVTANALPDLQQQEQQRVAQFTNPTDKNRYINAHAFLRQVLSRYIAVPPAEVSFEYTDLGQPVLSGAQAVVCFGLSYRNAQVIVGVSSHPIGVDIEQVSKTDIDSVAYNFFSKEECTALDAAINTNEKLILFFRIWTLKEAFIKGLGIGVGYDLQSFTVDPSAMPVQLHSTEIGWLLHEIEMPAGYVAAAAIKMDI